MNAPSYGNRLWTHRDRTKDSQGAVFDDYNEYAFAGPCIEYDSFSSRSYTRISVKNASPAADLQQDARTRAVNECNWKPLLGSKRIYSASCATTITIIDYDSDDSLSSLDGEAYHLDSEESDTPSCYFPDPLRRFLRSLSPSRGMV